MCTARSLLDDLLAGRCRDPDGGAPLAVPTRAVVIADSLAGGERECVMQLGLGARLAVVSDPDTQRVLGARVTRALGAAATPLLLESRPHADMPTVQRIRAATTHADALVAVGAGTVNDLCKYAAARDGKPYCVFGTAPSMNGYTSVNAAITEGGLKKSLPAAAPAGVFLDLAVLAAAPPRMIRAGLGDSLCRPTAQSDWLLAHLLRGEPYREAPFMLLAADEEALLGEPQALLAGDLSAMERLARTLVLSGFGMSLCGGSQPASQGEHLISHYLDMLHPELPQSFHGEHIAVTTLTMARLQRALLDDGPPRLAGGGGPRRRELLARYGTALGEACWHEFEPKRLDDTRAAALETRLAVVWEELVRRVQAIARPVETLERALQRAGAPRRAQDLGWPAPVYREAVAHAREIRNRWTALDLAAACGRLSDFAEGAA